MDNCLYFGLTNSRYETPKMSFTLLNRSFRCLTKSLVNILKKSPRPYGDNLYLVTVLGFERGRLGEVTARLSEGAGSQLYTKQLNPGLLQIVPDHAYYPFSSRGPLDSVTLSNRAVPAPLSCYLPRAVAAGGLSCQIPE